MFRNSCQLLLIFTLLLSPINVLASGMFELNVNTDELELVIEQISPVETAEITIQGSGIYHADDYFKFAAVLAASGEAFVPGFGAGLGFKPVAGRVEVQGNDETLVAVSFYGLVKYDFLPSVNIPLSIDMNIAIAPRPLSFSDTDSYWDYEGTVGFKVVETAMVVAGYRYFKFETENNRTYSKGSLYVGARLYF